MGVVSDVADLAAAAAKSASGDVDIAGLIKSSVSIAKDFVQPICSNSWSDWFAAFLKFKL